MATVSSLMYRVFGGLARVSRELTDEYRPELHYMRGPGPKWRERHGKSGVVQASWRAESRPTP